ncbi:Oidioi.mRNA.OKI2018_I69.XSR.g16897.t1.cds [Oikopleura dioica]|uniref:Oidioi.mRNA.OKI2018_I69.XSR.g16897.t1.cds n=1 Tax=Oikopleura dioica TaxID=34765 RepID=A0ABN7SHJ5_OIKDI|nr:Oidioi.mRNA.OKI2018_I69.XSR.g16897.t1.cds [Oikopleura dioica]
MELAARKQFHCREWLFSRIEEHINADPGEKGRRGFLLSGNAGTGKTTFLAELCSPIASAIVAHHFVSPFQPRTRKLSVFLKSVSSQLKTKFAPLGELPTSANGDVRSIANSWHSALAALPTPPQRHLLVIDGLELSTDIFSVVSNLNLPSWLSVVYSVAKGHKRSREMIKLLDKLLQKVTLDDIRKDPVCKDSQQYILRRLESNQNLRSAVNRDNAEFLSQLHIKASGCFLYLEVVLDGIASGLVGLRQVRDIPGTLSGLWLWLIQLLFAKKDFGKVRSMLEILAAAGSPMNTKTLAEAAKMLKPSTEEADVEKRLGLLKPLIYKDASGWIPIHSSFLAWCQDVKYSTSKFLCDVTKGHLALSTYYAVQCAQMRNSQNSEVKESGNSKYKRLTEQLLDHVRHTKFTEAELTLLLVSVGAEREVVRFMDMLAGNSLQDSECRLTTLATRGEEAQIVQLLDLGFDANGTQKDAEPTLVPLVAAGKFGSKKMVEHLINNGADPLRCEFPAKQNFFQSAAQHGHIEIIEWARTNFKVETLVKLLKAKDVEGRSALRLACWQGELEVVSLLATMSATAGLSLDEVDIEGRSCLFAATYTQTVDVVNCLLENKCDPNLADRESRTPLSIAALQNQPELCKMLLAAGADVNLPDMDGLTALHVACYECHENIVEILLDAKASVDKQDNSGLSVLMSAVITGNESIVKRVLAAGASLSLLDGDCRTVLSLAAQQGHVNLVKMFLEKGLDESHSDNIGWTPLHLVAAENHVKCCEALLEFRTNPDQRDNDGRTPLIVAAMEGHTEIMKSLLDAGADPDIQSYEGFSALRFATLDNQLESLNILVDAMADVDSIDPDGRSILYSCVLDQNEKMAKEILRQGADPESQDMEGRRPIHVAAWQGMTSIVKMLIEHGADPNSIDAEGRTAMQNASWQNHVSVVELLVAKGAAIDQFCHQGATPLCVAAQEGHIETCEALIRLGADPHQPDNCGRTPLRVAEKAGHTALLKILKSVQSQFSPIVPIKPVEHSAFSKSNQAGSSINSGKISQAESSGFVSDQNQEIINSPRNKKKQSVLQKKLNAAQYDMTNRTESECEYNFADEIKSLTLPKSFRRSTMKLNELDTGESTRKPTKTKNNLIKVITEDNSKNSEKSSISLNSSHASKVSNSNLSSSFQNGSINQSANSITSSNCTTPAKSSESGAKMRRSNSMKGRISQLSKRVSKISLNFKADKSTNSDDLSEDVLSFKRCTDKARINLAPAVNPHQLSTNKTPITEKLPAYMIPSGNEAQETMEFECDKRTAARLHVDQMISQSLRRAKR